MKFKGFENIAVIVFIFFIIISGIFSVNYFNSKGVFDAKVSYVNNFKSPYSAIISFDNKVNEELEFNVEIVYKRGNLVAGRDVIKCLGICESKIIIDKLFFDEYEAVIWTEYKGRLYEKKLDFVFEKPPALFSVSNKNNYIWEYGKYVQVNGIINTLDTSENTYAFDVFPTKTPALRTSFIKTCNGSCPFNFSLKSNILFGEYTINVYSRIDVVRSTFNVIPNKGNKTIENENQLEIPERYIRPKIEKIPEDTKLLDQFFLNGKSNWEGDWDNVDKELNKLDPIFKKNRLGEVKKIELKENNKYDLDINLAGSGIKFSNVNVGEINNFSVYYDSSLATDVVYADVANGSFDSSLVVLRKDGGFLETINVCDDYTDIETYNSMLNLSEEDPLTEDKPGYASQLCLSGWRDSGYDFEQNETHVWFNTTHFSAYSGSLYIFNPQSYPVVGGTWSVSFNTTETADLWVSASNGTTWSRDGIGTDLQFLNLKCGNDLVDYEWVNGSVFVSNYSCLDNTYETSRVITGGVHTKQFVYGVDVGYAKNFATSRGSGFLAYIEGTIQTPRYRVYDPDTNSWSAELSANSVGQSIEEVQVACSVARFECTLLTVDSGDDVEVQFYNGSCWHDGTTCGSTYILETTTNAEIGKRANLKYEEISGDLLVTWSGNAVDIIQYRVWDGNSWSSESNVNSGSLVTAGTPEWIELAQEPGTDNISMVFRTSSNEGGVIVYNGNTENFGCQVASGSRFTGLSNYVSVQNVDIEHEQVSGDLFAVGGTTGGSGSEFFYLTKPSGSCTYTLGTATNIDDDSSVIKLAPVWGSDTIIVETKDQGANDQDITAWDGSSELADGAGDATMEAETVGNQMLGIACPKDGTDRCVATYSDSNDASLSYYTYIPSTNTWAVQADYDGTPAMNAAGHDVNYCVSYPFSTDSEIMCIVEDDADDIWAKRYDSITNIFSDTEGGSALETSASPSEYKASAFTWVIFNVPYLPIAIDPFDGQTGTELDLNLTAYVEDPNSDPLITSFYWGNGTLIDFPVDSSWIDPSQPYRQQITFGGASSDIDSYTMNFEINSSVLGSNFDFSQDRDSLRFYFYNQSSGSTSLIPHYINSWNSGSEIADIILKIPLIDSVDDADIFLYYGDNTKPNVESYCDTFIYCDLFDDASINSSLSTTDQDTVAGTAFSEGSGVLSVTAGGADTWTGSDEYGSVYLSGISGDLDVIVGITSFTNPNAWAKAGIMFKNDMTASGSSTGYSFNALTPGNGYSYQSDATDNGFLDANVQNGAPSIANSYLRVVKSGTSFDGYYSKTTPDTWNLITSITMGSASTIQDLGLSYTSHAGATTGTVTFDNFTVQRHTTDSISKSFGSEEIKNSFASGSNASVEVLGLDYLTTYYWYVVVNDGTYTTTSSIFNFTTKPLILPSGNLILPVDSASFSTPSIDFSANATDDSGLDYATLYLWSSGGGIFDQVNYSLDGNLSSIFNISYTLPAGNYTWNILATDVEDNSAFLGVTNRTITVTAASLLVDYLNFLNPFEIRQNSTKALYVNVSCIGSDCMDVNTTLLYWNTASPISYFEDYETGTYGNWSADNGGGASGCTWILDQGGTPSGNTGPNVDNTLGTASGWYLYVENSGSGTTPPWFCDGTDSEATLNSSTFEAGSFSTNVSFWYHMFGANMGTLSLDVYNGTWNNEWSLTGAQQAAQGNAYLNANVDLSSYSGNIKIRFRYDWGGGFAGDVAIDDIQINTLFYSGYEAIPTVSSLPFWINASSNPDTISLNAGESQLLTYYINATGSIGSSYSSYFESLLNSVMGYNSNGSFFNISIVDSSPPNGNKVSPLNNTFTDNTSVVFRGTTTSSFGLKDATLYVWDGADNLIDTETINFSGEIIANASWNYSFISDDTYKWNILFTDVSDDSAWADNGVNFTITKSSRSADIDVSIVNPSTLTSKVVQVNTSFILNVTLSCNTIIESDCGTTDVYVQYNDSNTSFTNLLTSSSNPAWSISSQPQSCYLLDSQNCSLSWEINITGLPETFDLIRVFASSNSSYVSNKTSENLTIEVVDGETVKFDSDTLNLGSIIRNRGNAIRDVTIRSIIGNNTGITVSCVLGNCSLITDNWSDTTALNEGQGSDVTFTCLDTTEGILESIFEVSSNEDSSPSQIVVSCIVAPDPGSLTVSISSPSLSEIYNVSHDKTFNLNATITCVDNCGNLTGYVVYPGERDYWNVNWDYRRNLSIDITTGVSPNYQILLYLDDSNLGSNFDWTNNCDDIRFVNAMTSLDYWIQSCNTTSKEIYVWVETDTALSGGSSYNIDFYYGNNLAQSKSNASSTFRADEVYLVTGACAGSGNCDMDNHAEADTLRANIDGAGMGIYGTGYVAGIDDPDNPYGANDNYFTRYRLLWIPTTSSSFSFGSYNDDDMEISIIPYDSYGSGITGYNDFGANDPVTTQYGTWHNNNVCGSNVAIEGTRSLNANQGYWIDYISIEGGGGEDQQMCVNSGSGYNTFDSTNFAGQFFARSYIGGVEPSLASVGSEEVLSSVSTISGSKPFWIEFNQPQNCGLYFTGTCTLSFEVNASDLIWNIYNLTVIVSSDIEDVITNTSEILQVRIINKNPQINLSYPFGKVISNGTVEFSWNVSDYDDSIFDCRIFVDSILTSTSTCYYGENKLNLTILSFTEHNWSVNATDYYNGTNISSTLDFLLIKNQFKKLSKSVRSLGSDIYENLLISENLIVSTDNTTIFNLVNNQYTINSFVPNYNFTYSTSVLPYLGDIYGSNFTFNPLLSQNNLNYSITGFGFDYELSDTFIFGLE